MQRAGIETARFDGGWAGEGANEVRMHGGSVSADPSLCQEQLSTQHKDKMRHVSSINASSSQHKCCPCGTPCTSGHPVLQVAFQHFISRGHLTPCSALFGECYSQFHGLIHSRQILWGAGGCICTHWDCTHPSICSDTGLLQSGSCTQLVLSLC